jgi:hypothetical protein
MPVNMVKRPIIFVLKGVWIHLKKILINMLRNKYILTLLIFIFSLFGFFLVKNQTSEPSVKSANDEQKIKAVIYKPPTCSCCLGHAGYLEGEGFDVETIVENDIEKIKNKYNIPYNMQSCHTTQIDGYFVEGHVPVEAINKLLAERPDIDGIALPDMPAGSPGMPGTKDEEFIIYALKDGNAKEFIRL